VETVRLLLSLASRLSMRTGIALGSNLEPRLAHLQSARRLIFGLHSGPEPVLCSKVYETSPVDCPPDSPLFLNAVLELSTTLEPENLLREIKRIERALGRLPSGEKNAPRTIDLDLLYCENIAISTPSLTLPHPRIAYRRFVLRPLADIQPKLLLPNLSKTIQKLLEDLKSDESVSVYCNAIY
jgi:2-amino-4-hydroxy-6-hydroxymethyldihydropteridine diphosphokinase